MSAGFRLQRVLELKERREQASATRLAEARTRAEDARAAEQELEALREGGAARWPIAAKVTVGQMQNLGFVLGQLDARIDAARAAVRQADEVVEERRVEFGVAARERNALDRLRQKAADAALRAALDADRKKMDEIALTRFFRGGPNNEGVGQ